MCRSKGGFTTKIHAVVDALGQAVRFTLTSGHRNDITQAPVLIEGIKGATPIRVMNSFFNTYKLTLNDIKNNKISEFQDAYEYNSNSYYGNKWWEWIENNCRSVEFEPQEIENWSDLKELHLQSNDLSELPDDISKLTGLVDLSLFHNNFSIVPEVIFNLTKLTQLDL